MLFLDDDGLALVLCLSSVVDIAFSSRCKRFQLSKLETSVVFQDKNIMEIGIRCTVSSQCVAAFFWTELFCHLRLLVGCWDLGLRRSILFAERIGSETWRKDFSGGFSLPGVALVRHTDVWYPPPSQSVAYDTSRLPLTASSLSVSLLPVPVGYQTSYQYRYSSERPTVAFLPVLTRRPVPSIDLEK
jgi:hypothetical protein